LSLVSDQRTDKDGLLAGEFDGIPSPMGLQEFQFTKPAPRAFAHNVKAPAPSHSILMNLIQIY
jgi:hypothetical protein